MKLAKGVITSLKTVPLCLGLLVTTTSSATAEVKEFFGYLSSYMNKEYIFDVFFDDDYILDEIICFSI